jgi:hypothetical protein
MKPMAHKSLPAGDATRHDPHKHPRPAREFQSIGVASGDVCEVGQMVFESVIDREWREPPPECQAPLQASRQGRLYLEDLAQFIGQHGGGLDFSLGPL